MQVFDRDSNIFKILSEAVSEGILVVNHEQTIVATNQRANDMFGYGADELLGKPLTILIPSSYQKAHEKHVDGYYQQYDKRRMAVGRHLYGVGKDQKAFPVEVGLNPFALYGNTYVLALVIDVTLIKEKEREIRELNTMLEEKIVVRTKELEATVANLKTEIKLREEAEAKITNALQKERDLNDLKTKFLSLVSHEFKTPLSGILTSATLIGKYTETDQQEIRNRHLKTIQGEVRHLNNILNDFLSVERLEKGKELYRLSAFSLSNVVNEVVYNANMMLKSGQKINYPQNIDDISICQDPKIVSLALTNLLYNAIKYSPEDTLIELQVDLDSDRIKFHVIDQGIGIPQQDQKHIFERYFRAENVLLNQGTGIGLNIVKAHLENLGGKIAFVSEENKGSIFTVEFPLGDEAENRADS